MDSRLVILPGAELTLTELSAARLDGDVVELGRAFVASDTVEDQAMRARSVAQLVPHPLVATLGTAAWIHDGCSRPPEVVEVQWSGPRRPHPRATSGVRFRDSPLHPDAVVDIAGTQVTDLVRTIVDLARSKNPLDSPRLRQLLASKTITTDAVLAYIQEHPRLPGIAQARKRITQEDVTR